MMGTIGKCAVFPVTGEPGIMDSHLLRIQANPDRVDREYLRIVISSEQVVGRQVDQLSHGSIMAGLSSSIVRRLVVPLPPLLEQRRIAEILDTLDEATRRYRDVIDRLQQAKDGLLRDLLTRGIDENGEVRDPEQHPEQFKDSPLGMIPRCWSFVSIESVIESAVDGPFGTHLKTEHYVEEGVRVVRLQNIGAGRFLSDDKAFVSKAHALSLRRHEVLPGDLVVASLGDENHPIARACCYPLDFEPGIVKADCFRLRADRSAADNRFLSLR